MDRMTRATAIFAALVMGAMFLALLFFGTADAADGASSTEPWYRGLWRLLAIIAGDEWI